MRTSDKECENEGWDRAVLDLHALTHSHPSLGLTEHVGGQMHISLQMKCLHGFWHCSVESAKGKPSLPPIRSLYKLPMNAMDRYPGTGPKTAFGEAALHDSSKRTSGPREPAIDKSCFQSKCQIRRLTFSPARPDTSRLLSINRLPRHKPSWLRSRRSSQGTMSTVRA